MESVSIIAGVSLVGGAIGLAVGAVAAFRAFQTARLISSTPATPIADLDPGLHEVKGSLGGEPTLESPLSHRPCAYWHVTVEHRKKNRWESVVDRRAGVPVALDDGSGRVLLDLLAAQVVVSSPQRIRSGIFGVPSAELDDLFTRLEFAPGELQGPFLRYREEVLEPGDRLYAVATAARGADESWELRAENDVFVVSDRDEAEVVRHQQRTGQRWLALAIAGFAFVAVGAWVYVTNA